MGRGRGAARGDPGGGRRDRRPAARLARRRAASVSRQAARPPTPTATATRWRAGSPPVDELLELCGVGRPARGHHAGGDRRGLPEGLQRGGERAAGPDERPRQPPAQLERAHRRGGPTPAGSSTSSARRVGPARSAAGWWPSPCRSSSTNNMSFGTFCALWLIPGWSDRLNALDREAGGEPRRRGGPGRDDRAGGQGTPFQRLAEFGNYTHRRHPGAREPAVRGPRRRRDRRGAWGRPLPG